MFGGSKSFTIQLDDNTICLIKVKRPQFLITSLKRREEYLYTLSENKLDTNTTIVTDCKIDTLVNTLSAIWNIHKIRDFISKIGTLIETNITTGVNTTRDEMHIIGLQILRRHLNYKCITDELEMQNQRLNELLLKGKKDANEFYRQNVVKPYKLPLPVIVEEGGLLRRKSIRRKSIRNKSR
jgi:hypothetical protein